MDKTLSDKIAAEAAREINREIANNTANYDFLADEEIAAIIERALSQSLAARDKEIEELAQGWKKEAHEAVPPEYADRGLHYKYLKTDVYAAGQDDCADELLALLKGKAI